MRRIQTMISTGVGRLRQAIYANRTSISFLKAQEAERQRLALTLHDNALQSLAIIHLGLSTLSQETNSDQLHKMAASVNDVSVELRAVCQGLYPPVLSCGNIIDVIEAVCHWARISLNLSVNLVINVANESQTNVSSELNETVYYIAKEALCNVIKHAGVNKAVVKMKVGSDSLQLIIEDHGIGIDHDKVSQPSPEPHYGLLGMQERAKVVRGRISIKSRTPTGTKVFFEVPFYL